MPCHCIVNKELDKQKQDFKVTALFKYYISLSVKAQKVTKLYLTFLPAAAFKYFINKDVIKPLTYTISGIIAMESWKSTNKLG